MSYLIWNPKLEAKRAALEAQATALLRADARRRRRRFNRNRSQPHYHHYRHQVGCHCQICDVLCVAKIPVTDAPAPSCPEECLTMANKKPKPKLVEEPTEVTPVAEPSVGAEPADGAAPADDPFDPANLRISQDFVSSSGVKKLLTEVPVRKPGHQEFIRVNSDPNYWMAVAIIELKDDREFYLLKPEIVKQLPGEFVMVNLFTTMNRQGVLSLWPVRLPATDGKPNKWHGSASSQACHDAVDPRQAQHVGRLLRDL